MGPAAPPNRCPAGLKLPFGGRMEDYMKVVVWKSPRFLKGLLRFLFRIKED